MPILYITHGDRKRLILCSIVVLQISLVTAKCFVICVVPYSMDAGTKFATLTNMEETECDREQETDTDKPRQK